jgi:hypothetical protein
MLLRIALHCSGTYASAELTGRALKTRVLGAPTTFLSICFVLILSHQSHFGGFLRYRACPHTILQEAGFSQRAFSTS